MNILIKCCVKFVEVKLNKVGQVLQATERELFKYQLHYFIGFPVNSY